MAFGFLPPYPSKFEAWTLPPDGRNWRLLEPLVYKCKDGRLIRAAVGTLTDGVSTPRIIWNQFSPFDYWMCGVIHDAAYKDTVEICATFDAGLGFWKPDYVWTKYTMNEAQANDLIDEALESRGCEIIVRNTVFNALRIAGKFAFNDDRTGTPSPTPVPT